MNPVFDFLSIISNGWHLPVRLVDSGLANKALRLGGLSQARTRHLITCLVWMGLWPLSCVQPEPVEKAAAARQATPSGCNKPDCVPTNAGRAPKGAPPPPAPQGLPVPTFSPQAGTFSFGTRINLSVSTLPTGATIEYSYDGGKTWITGDKAPVIGTDPILARTRINDLTSGISQAEFRPYYRRMLVLGNSIMSHPPAPAQGWFNSNGMAASAPDKDFVHLLTARLAGQYPQFAVRLASSGDFERRFSDSNYSLDEFNEPLQQFKPDLIIVRLGENVDEGEVLGTRSFESQFRLLLDRLATYGGQPVKLVCTTSVWKRPQVDAIIRRVTTEKGIALANLSGMLGQDQYYAIGAYANAAVSAHPNDAGMKRIADLILEKLP